ncbi:MAG: DUF3429 domain-containing protein [Nitratireductor sp.]|nr:DUF3429 domain-containing protein [Nitratireductor sp.]
MTSDDQGAGQAAADRAAKRFEKTAYLLGFAGLLPFLACVALLYFSLASGALVRPVGDIFTAYSIAVLSFLGGIRWGHVMPRQDDDGAGHSTGHRAGPVVLCLSVLPVVLGWGALFLPRSAAIALLLIAFCIQGVWDSFSAHFSAHFSARGGGLPRWFAPLRILLTAAVALCHAAVLLMIGFD